MDHGESYVLWHIFLVAVINVKRFPHWKCLFLINAFSEWCVWHMSVCAYRVRGVMWRVDMCIYGVCEHDVSVGFMCLNYSTFISMFKSFKDSIL